MINDNHLEFLRNFRHDFNNYFSTVYMIIEDLNDNLAEMKAQDEKNNENEKNEKIVNNL
ncbi:MAG: hypothetical protein HQK51_20925, partial [Oligoflexia bacterium]|nr:hypothetical protein [Oligoflexia bacterium]